MIRIDLRLFEDCFPTFFLQKDNKNPNIKNKINIFLKKCSNLHMLIFKIKFIYFNLPLNNSSNCLQQITLNFKLSNNKKLRYY